MNIIEKLGIESEYKTSMVNGDIVLKLEKQRDDMLDALIELVDNFDINNGSSDQKALVAGLQAIEKACYPKSWEEIKELM